MSRHRRRRSASTDHTLEFVIELLLWIFFLPILGLALLCSSDSNKRTTGVILLGVGILLWILIAGA